MVLGAFALGEQEKVPLHAPVQPSVVTMVNTQSPAAIESMADESD